jgi:hypothetical protein
MNATAVGMCNAHDPAGFANAFVAIWERSNWRRILFGDSIIQF